MNSVLVDSVSDFIRIQDADWDDALSTFLQRTVRGTLVRTNVIEVREYLCISLQNDIKAINQ